MQRLVPLVGALVRRAAGLGIQLTIDAEEADRLDLSLDVIEALAKDPATRHWPGLGLAVQAYGKRALDVIDWVAATARNYGRRMTVRLVKGAYWDTEIKRAQERGLDGYPVYTRKVTTDVSYLACVGRLFSHADVIYPQFATHNAHSIASVLELAPAGADYEFQRLHGMGRLLYAEAARQIAKFPRVRIYAPVGEHKDLLAYLVRRLLENGANTSFVNRFMDEQVPVAEIVRDPISEIERLETYAHPRLPVPARAVCRSAQFPRRRFGQSARRSRRCARRFPARRPAKPTAGPIIDGVLLPGATHPVTNPADRRDVVGSTRDAVPEEIAKAFDAGAAAQPAWNAMGAARRARACSTRRPTCWKRAARIFMSSWCVRRARAYRTPSRRFARPWISAAITRFEHAPSSRRPSVCRAPPANRTSCRCTAAACSPASVRGTFPWRFSPARSPPRWRPAMPSWRSRRNPRR